MAKVTAEHKYVVNLGNYESAHIGFRFEDDVQPGETLDEAGERLYRQAKSHTEAAVREELGK